MSEEYNKKKSGIRKKFLLTLMSYTNAIRPIIYIDNFDSSDIDKDIKRIGGKKTKIIEYNTALGLVDYNCKKQLMSCNLEQFLRSQYENGYFEQTFLVLKDVNEEINDAKVTALLKRIAELNFRIEKYYCTVFVISSNMEIPREIEEYVTIVDYPLPDEDEIHEIISEFKEDYKLKISDGDLDELALSFKGLNKFQIRQILGTAYQQKGNLSKDDKSLILREKTQFIKKSGMLEIVNFKENIEDIGGLENLKDWLRNKAVVFNNLDKAIKFGVDVPKGVMIVGMPGCGKSLTAKATAALFNVPLARLDIGRLLGKYVGESEGNMRKALQLAEAISPCVLWVDELEKAFSGVGSGSEITTRLFGQFLTWMQEKDNTVFMVATANDISSLPPEFLRKGRFDEVFFVDLPNLEERKKILDIHLKKRKQSLGGKDIEALASKMDGYNGADIEGVVKETVESWFVEKHSDQEALKLGKSIPLENFEKMVSDTKSITDTMGDKLDQIKDLITKKSIRSASKTEG